MFCTYIEVCSGNVRWLSISSILYRVIHALHFLPSLTYYGVGYQWIRLAVSLLWLTLPAYLCHLGLKLITSLHFWPQLYATQRNAPLGPQIGVLSAACCFVATLSSPRSLFLFMGDVF
ncbi:hypothetical protein F4818DRAFT_347199 [Hypoxylon cercidicola]|nr:hypothetical protein F4818DRAFT_347199 [Hypoxylon cercidicola]